MRTSFQAVKTPQRHLASKKADPYNPLMPICKLRFPNPIPPEPDGPPIERPLPPKKKKVKEKLAGEMGGEIKDTKIDRKS